MKKIASYEQYQEVASICFIIRKVREFSTEGKSEEQLQNRNDFLKPKFDKLALLSFTYDEAEEALAYDKEQYERIKKAVSASTVGNFQSAIDSMWEEGVPALTALDKANKAVLSPEDAEWV